MLRFKSLQDGPEHYVDQPRVPSAMPGGKRFRLCHGAEERARCLLHFFPARAVSIGDAFQHAPEAGAAHAILRRKVSAAIERPAVGEQKPGERPTTLAGDSAHGRLVTRVHVWSLVSVHLNGDEQSVDQRCKFGIVVALAVDDVAPMAPYGANIEQDRLVFARVRRHIKRLRAPFVHTPRSWCAAERKYGLVDSARRFAFSSLTGKLPFAGMPAVVPRRSAAGYGHWMESCQRSASS